MRDGMKKVREGRDRVEEKRKIVEEGKEREIKVGNYRKRKEARGMKNESHIAE